MIVADASAVVIDVVPAEKSISEFSNNIFCVVCKLEEFVPSKTKLVKTTSVSYRSFSLASLVNPASRTIKLLGSFINPFPSVAFKTSFSPALVESLSVPLRTTSAPYSISASSIINEPTFPLKMVSGALSNKNFTCLSS